jgi:hypothetical protein
VGLAGAGVGGRGAIALEHGAGLPSRKAHEVSLTASFGQPLVRKGVAELVRMQPRKAGLPTATPQHHHQPVRSEPTLQANPQPGEISVLVAGADAQIALERQWRAR